MTKIIEKSENSDLFFWLGEDGNLWVVDKDDFLKRIEEESTAECGCGDGHDC